MPYSCYQLAGVGEQYVHVCARDYMVHSSMSVHGEVDIACLLYILRATLFAEPGALSFGKSS